MEGIKNLDLISVGITIAAIGVLGFIVFFSNRKSITSKSFLLFSFVTIFWGVVNYINYQVYSSVLALWLLRLVIFLAVWQVYSFFQLFYVFPNEVVKFSKLFKFVILPLAIITSILNLTPYVFRGFKTFSSVGHVSVVQPAPGVILFIIVAIGLAISSIILIIKKIKRASGIEKNQLIYVLIGVAISLALLSIFNLILPVVFDNTRFVPLGALFMLPFISFTFFAIFKHHLLNIKVIATEILAFVLAVVSLIEIILSTDITTIIIRSGVFLLVLSFGILLIRSVLKEVEQREQLAVANEKLKELDKIKTQFLSFASHQVKAPMNVVKGYATLIYDGTYGPVSDKIRETAVKIKESADRMIALVNNIMDLRKIEEGKMEFKFEDVNIGNIAGEVVEEFRTLAMNKNLSLQYDKPQLILMANVDAQKIRQSIQNLVDNAIKYTDTGWIKVVVEESGNKDSILISVSDSGHGISKELLAKLFDQYQRDSATASKIEGTGLGLYIAKQIIEANHGSIWAESEGAGKGSKFYVKLPRSLTS